MKIYQQRGERISHTAAAAIASGAVVPIGDLIGIAENSGAIGDEVSVLLEGVFPIAKGTSEAISKGAVLYWDATNKVVTATAGSNKVIGKAFAAALAADATVPVRIRN
jgi:predicted RecA/RadA family phage recombinase